MRHGDGCSLRERLHALDGGRDGGKGLATGEEQPHKAAPRDERKEKAAAEAEQQRERPHARHGGGGRGEGLATLEEQPDEAAPRDERAVRKR